MSAVPPLAESVQSFLYLEARLLDEGKLEQWVDLFTEDALYWMPSNQMEVDPKTHVCVVYANKARLGEYIARARSGTFWAQDPPSRTSRIVGNFMIEPGEGECRVESRFNLTEVRRNRLRVLAGTYRHRLLRQNGSWKIREKQVQLINNDEPLDNLTLMV
jgi:3-phenylpropionate/cinnamic acid dioxygenase small subunit